MYLNIKDRHCLRVRSWKKIFQESGPTKEVVVVILIQNKIDVKAKLIKEKIHQQGVLILHISAQNSGTFMLVNETLL